jgi:hypothetical protein
MQRRDFLPLSAGRWWHRPRRRSAGLHAAASALGAAHGSQGGHRLHPPGHARAGGLARAGQVEVVEFFAYTCIHCYNFEPIFEDWIKKKPARSWWCAARRWPSARPSCPCSACITRWKVHGPGGCKLHAKVFSAIHVERLRLTTAGRHRRLGGQAGCGPRQVQPRFCNSFRPRPATKARKAAQLQDAYRGGRHAGPGRGRALLRPGPGTAHAGGGRRAHRRSAQGLSGPAALCATPSRGRHLRPAKRFLGVSRLQLLGTQHIAPKGPFAPKVVWEICSGVAPLQ